MRRVEAPVEADLERDARRVDRPERAIELDEIERHGLLAEHRLAGLGRRDQQLDVGVGARADRHRIEIAGEDLLHRGHRGHPELGRDVARDRLVGVEHRAERGAWHLVGDQLGVHAPDPPDADDADPQRRDGRCRGHERTSSQPPLSTERKSASCTAAQASASSKLGSNGRPSATAVQNS